MKWSKFPRWLKGGTIGCGLFAVLLLLAFVIDRIWPPSGHPPLGATFFVLVPGLWLLEALALPNNFFGWPFVFAFCALIYFSAGLAVGWLVERIRTKK